MKPLISIIVPVYNASEFLGDCLESILTQTYDNLEVLVIDDGSTDTSSALIEKFVRKDSRIKMLRQENKGQAAARNRGLDNAGGAYILFVDSDDVVSKTHVATLYAALIQHQAQVALCRPTRRLSELQTNEKVSSKALTGSFTSLLTHEEHDFARMGAWAKIYEHEILKTVRFREGMIYEDNLFFYDMLNQVVRVAYVYTTTYYYRLRQSSTVMGKITEKNFDIFKRNALLKEWFSVNHPESMSYIQKDCQKMLDSYALKASREKSALARELFSQICKENASSGHFRHHYIPFYLLTLYIGQVWLRFKQLSRRILK